MFNPVSTYRIQFHKDFTFKTLKEIIPYLHGLGIKTLYASPIFEATPGSMHGYDIVNPLNINPEIGTIAELRTLSCELKKQGISWLQDIVPNHMAFHPNNTWLMDVLKNGKTSAYAPFFDIEWDSPVYEGRLMVPFLGLPFEEALTQKQIQLVKRDGGLYLEYFDQHYPVRADLLKKLSPAYIGQVNSDPELLKTIAEQQAYQLCHWQETDRQINYRRFFTVNGLICLNIQREEVFTEYHLLIKQLLDEGIFQGLRVDHIDGLQDPEGYLKRLRNLAGPETYITVEKILETGERFPLSWPVQGNTGYDFLAMVNNLFTYNKSEKSFTRFVRKPGSTKSVSRDILEKKELILQRHLAGELDNLHRLFIQLNLASAKELKAIGGRLKEAIAQFLINCPVYRFYGNGMPLTEQESDAVRSVIHQAAETHPKLANALQLLEKALLIIPQSDTNYGPRALSFYRRCMQFTGPLMAKGVEDTLMYTDNRFIGHNEVGDSPGAFGISANNFHQLMAERRKDWPLSLNATSTHDTKRGEDVRARLNVLTDMPDEWFALVERWQSENIKLKRDDAPDTGDEYFIYQSITGAHPMPGSEEADFISRMQAYLVKALREGKEHSDWAAPDEAYEKAVQAFIAGLLSPKSTFRKTFNSFHQQIAGYGIINSLSQVLLKFTCPGVPDIYQGCEDWDLGLVDPDNRRPVDYGLRQHFLNDNNSWQQLWQNRYNGQIKQQLIRRLLQLRAAKPSVFTTGAYFPLTVNGKYKNNILAFARQLGAEWYITVLPLHLVQIGVDAANPQTFDWANTVIELPQAAPRNWESQLSTAKGYTAELLPVNHLFKEIPLALIKLSAPENRGAGLLLHVTSLPSAFGSGDIGPQAYRFIDFLFESGQRYWQMLPVNTVDKAASYSPYSASSSMAGNTLLISPELLINKGWLNRKDLEKYAPLAGKHVDLESAANIRIKLFEQAYRSFLNTVMKAEFESFKIAEAHWLNEFALYQVLKQNHQHKPWYEWPEEFKQRRSASLKKFSRAFADALEKEKWLQYVFNTQWRELRAYATDKGITLFGDMPFYISYDSADVWSHPEWFKLNEQGKPMGVAGVPPDYFSKDGQLWGMPVYNWPAIKKENYNWWLQRIRKNLEYFELIRLDHFRAFAAYWEVPGDEPTAVNGKWVPGPGAAFFKEVKKALEGLPFVAEDLGDIDDTVIELRDRFNLPGMRVLQFAFGNDLPQSVHAPHNYSVNSFAYTGTHDNNTLKGWYKEDAGKTGRQLIDRYLGKKADEQSICNRLIRLCYASVAKAAILPVQDLLELDSTHRMNLPSSPEGNWTWRLGEGQLTEKLARRLRELTLLYNR